MGYNPLNPNGQATSANSSPSVLSIEQEAKIDLLSKEATLSNINNKLTASAITNTGTLSGAAQVVSLSITEESAASVQITGTWVGTILFEASLDGITFNPINAVSSSTSSPQSTTTVNGLYRLTPAGTLSFRANMTAFTSGSASILMRASKGTGGIFANQILPIKIDQTTNGTTNRVNIGTDGTVISNAGTDTPNILATGSIIATSTANSFVVNNTNSGASCSFVVTGLTASGATLTIEGSDNNGVSYSAINGVLATGVLINTISADGQFRVNAAARTQLRLKVSIVGTGTITVASTLSSATGLVVLSASLPNGTNLIGAVNTSQLNGIVISTNIGASDAGTQRFLLANEQVQDLYFTGQAAQTATIQNIISTSASVNATDVTGFSSGSIQIVSTGTGGTFIFEGANDTPTSANYVTIPVWNSTIQTGTPTTAAITASVSSILYIFPVNYRYIRVRIATTITGGSIQAFTTIKKANFTGSSLQISQSSTANLNATVAGQTGHSSASSGNPVRVAGRVKTAVDTTLVAGDISDIACTSDQSAIIRPFAAPELDWGFASAAGGIVNTTDVVLATAAGASIRRYITGINVQNASATIATEVVLKDGATIIWRGYVGAQTVLNSAVGIIFPTPLKTTANTALNFACITTAAQVYVNAQGYNAI